MAEVAALDLETPHAPNDGCTRWWCDKLPGVVGHERVAVFLVSSILPEAATRALDSLPVAVGFLTCSRVGKCSGLAVLCSHCLLLQSDVVVRILRILQKLQDAGLALLRLHGGCVLKGLLVHVMFGSCGLQLCHGFGDPG